MKSYQWQLVKSFPLPTDSKGRQLYRVDFTPNYFEDLAKLRKEYSDYQQELRGDVHEGREFWVLLPTPEPCKMDEDSPFPNPKPSQRLRKGIMTTKPTPKNNNISPIDFKKMQSKEGFKGDLDKLYEQVENILHDEMIATQPELADLLQQVYWAIQQMS